MQLSSNFFLTLYAVKSISLVYYSWVASLKHFWLIPNSLFYFPFLCISSVHSFSFIHRCTSSCPWIAALLPPFVFCAPFYSSSFLSVTTANPSTFSSIIQQLLICHSYSISPFIVLSVHPVCILSSSFYFYLSYVSLSLQVMTVQWWREYLTMQRQ